MSGVDLSNKDMYNMLNENIDVQNQPMQPMQEMPPMPPMPPMQPQPMPPLPPMPSQVEPKPVAPTGPKKMVRSFKGFVMFALVVILVAAFIYFTVYRLGWGVKECMNKNFHDCAALLTPEIAPLAATGLLAIL